MSRPPESEASTRLTINLPTALVRALDEHLRDVGSSREVTIRRLIEAALRDRAATE